MSQTYGKELDAYIEKEKQYRAEIERIKESRGDMGQWFAGLQKALTDAGWDVDLSSPNDLVRFIIMDTELDVGEGAFEGTPRYAFDTQQRAFDPKTIRGEDWEKSFDPVPSPKMLHQLYTAAQNGTLFLMDYAMHVPNSYHVQIRANGPEASVSKPINEVSELEAASTSILKKPVKPAKPSLFTRFLAVFGNKKASAEVRKYDRDYKRYDNRKKLWDSAEKVRTEHPDVYAEALKKIGADQVFFANGLEYGEKLYAHQMRANDLHLALVNEKVVPIQKAINERYRQTQEEIRQLLDKEAAPDDGRQLADKVAVLGCLADAKKKMDAAVAGKVGNVRILPFGKAFDRAVLEYKRSDEFKAIKQSLNKEHLDVIADVGDVQKSMEKLGELQERAKLTVAERQKKAEREYLMGLKKNIGFDQEAAVTSFASMEEKQQVRNLGIDATRGGIDNIAVSMMLEEGKYAISDIFDPNKLREEKKAYGQKAIGLIRDGKAKEIIGHLFFGMKKLGDASTDILNKLPDLEFHTLNDPKYAGIIGMTNAMKGMYQNYIKVAEHMEERPESPELEKVASRADMVSHIFINFIYTGTLVDFVNGKEVAPYMVKDAIDKALRARAQSDIFRKMIKDPKNAGKSVMDMIVTENEGREEQYSDYGGHLHTTAFDEQTNDCLSDLQLYVGKPEHMEATKKLAKQLLNDQIKFTTKIQQHDGITTVSIPEVKDIYNGYRKDAKMSLKNDPAAVNVQDVPVQQIK